MNISLCIATYRRPQRLSALLDDIVKQDQLPDEVLVVDNDALGSARAVVELRRELGIPFSLHYDIQPVKNISMTRNRTVALASGDWIAFIDDDERAPVDWLKELTGTAARFTADGVLGPVVPIIPYQAPEWIRRGKFYEWARMKTGEHVPYNKLRFGNVLLRGSLLRDMQIPFDPDYGITGGEDGDLLSRLAKQGARIVWCDEAFVHEPIEAARLSLRWLLLRALRGGQDFARHRLKGLFGEMTLAGRVSFLLRALLQSAVAAGLALLSLPRGKHHAVHWLIKATANLGKISIFLGWHYREYGEKAT